MESVRNHVGFICRHFQHPSKIDRAVAKSVQPQARYTLTKTSEVLWEFCVKFNQGLANFDIKHCIANKLEIRHDRLGAKTKLRSRDTNIHVSCNNMLCQLVNFYRRFEGTYFLPFYNELIQTLDTAFNCKRLEYLTVPL
jgi:hypothetical protein